MATLPTIWMVKQPHLADRGMVALVQVIMALPVYIVEVSIVQAHRVQE